MPREKLKSFGTFLKGYIITLVLAAVAIIAVSSCGNAPKLCDCPECEDTISVTERVEAVINPVFLTTVEALDYQQSLIENDEVNVSFKKIPRNTLGDICSVLIKNNRSLTKKAIVDEYKSHKDIYETLSESTGNKKSDDSIARKDKIPISVSYQYKTDTVNGKPVRIKVKQEEYYE